MDGLVFFQGVRFRRYPTQPYYIGFRNGKNVYLHRMVWQEAHGPIPAGLHVHHKDGDVTNNDIDNLELISAEDHGRAHAREALQAKRSAASRAKASASMRRVWEERRNGRA